MAEGIEITREQLITLAFIGGESIIDSLKNDYYITLKAICKHHVDRERCSVCKSHFIKPGMTGHIVDFMSPDRINVSLDTKQFFQIIHKEFALEDLLFWENE